jgi:2,6-dihydroxypyridine 3-monooxygenase
LVKVAVVGGSLGGLIVGCLLADDGHDVTIYERSPVPLEERGAGIGFLPMTQRYLSERAGLDLDTISVTTEHIRHLRRDASIEHESKQHYLFSSWNTVYREMLQCFDSAKYLLGHEMIGLDTDATRIEFSNGLMVEPDLVVCTDGVGSYARSVLHTAAEPDYAGYVAWRGVVPESELSADTLCALDDAITYYNYANSHILVYPIPGRDGSILPGERLVNIVWYRNYQSGDDLDNLMLDRRGVARQVSMPPGALRDVHLDEARAVAEARLPWPIAEVVQAVPELFIQVVLDLAVDRMAFNRTVIMGDAAFVVRPHAAAGTAKAAADAWALRDALVQHPGDLTGALSAWEPGQLALGQSLLTRTRAIGRRSQFDGTWQVTDPDIIFGLYAPGN